MILRCPHGVVLKEDEWCSKCIRPSIAREVLPKDEGNHTSDQHAESFIEERMREFDSLFWVRPNTTMEEDGTEYWIGDVPGPTHIKSWIKQSFEEQQARFKKLLEERKAMSLDIQARLSKGGYEDEESEAMMERADVRITELDTLLQALQSESREENQ